MKVLLSLLIVLSFHAQASFLIEPYAGFSINGKWQGDGVGVNEENFSGSMYGARAGIERMGFMIGLDGRFGTWSIDDTAETELAYTTYGFFVGYNFPMMFRVFATYIIGGSGEVDDVGDYLAPSGYTFGAGYKLLPWVSLNLEYGTVEFSEFENTAGVNDSGRSDKGTYYLLSISVPINIGI